jgi:hypothetical protein
LKSPAKELSYDLKHGDSISPQNELRDILYEILDEKRNQARIDGDNEN